MAYQGPKDLWHCTSAASPASAGRAAQPNSQHVAKRVTASIAAGATVQTPLLLLLRDGAVGVGAILKQWTASLGADGNWQVDADYLDVVGTLGNAMTLEWSGAGAAGVQQVANLTGYDLP